MGRGRSDWVESPNRKVPVTSDVDVVVAGGGVSGIFAALGAARAGAKVAIVDRFGTLGGNIGPGMCAAGSMLLGHGKVKEGVPKEWVYGGIKGLPREFAERYEELGGGGSESRRIHHIRDAQIAVYVIHRMMEDGGVEMILSSYACDPILDGERVGGLFVENKSGRQAIRARVTVDATGEADLVRRAGGPILQPKESYFQLDGHAPTGMGTWCFAAGVDWHAYDTFRESAPCPDEDDLSWCRQNLIWEYPAHLVRLLREAWESGGYRALKEIDGLARVRSWEPKIRIQAEGIAGFKIQLDRPHGLVDAGNGEHISKLEAGIRSFCFETVDFWRRRVPGFERAYLLSVAPFLGNRGGPCIKGDYTITHEDCMAGRRFDDVIYIYGEGRALRFTCKEQGQCKWTDVPYRVMLPEGLDGILAVGRSASCIPDTLLRNRVALMHMGQAGGVAAALAARASIGPRWLPIRELQRALLREGFYLGDQGRLRELGLA